MLSEMDIEYKIISEDPREFPWDKAELEAFRKLITEKGLNHRTDDIFLLGFLRAKKFERERSLKLIKNYYSIRKKYTNFFTNLNPLSLEDPLNFKFLQFLPNPDQDGRPIIIARISNWDLSVSALDVARCFLLNFDFLLNFHRTQVNGIVIVINVKNTTWGHVIQFTPKFVISLIDTLYESNPIRYKEIHFVNMNGLFQMIMTVVLPFLPYKLRKRMHFHGSDMNSLHKFIHPNFLPADVGGELPIFDPAEANQILKKHEEFFRMNENTWIQS